jgi:hypothetical protein
MLSQKIEVLLEEYANKPLSIEILLERTGELGFGLLTGFLTLPLLIPVPLPLAGFSTLLGFGIILLGLQLAFGISKPYLPKFLTRLEIPPTLSQKLLQNLNRILRPLERLAKIRLLGISRNPVLRRFFGLCLVLNAALMALPLPIPFTNLLPAYTILVLSVGSFESDGVFLLVGYGLTGATFFFFASIANVIWDLLQS